MKNLRWLVVLVIMMIPVSVIAKPDDTKLGVFLNLTPGIFIYSPDVDGFQASDGWKTDEVSGYLSNMATGMIGLSFDNPTMFTDIGIGLGYLYNSSFTATSFLADVALRFKLKREEMTLGPHLSIVKYKPHWKGDADISLSDPTGIIAGLSFTMGSKAFSLMASLDYLTASFDAERPSMSLHGNSLDLSGIALQLGVIFRF